MRLNIERTADDPWTDRITGLEIMLTADIESNFKRYGQHPMCAGCKDSCKQYRAPGLTRLVCKRGEAGAGCGRH